MGYSSRILDGPGTKSRLYEGPETFLAPLNGTSDSEGNFGAKKVESPIRYKGSQRIFCKRFSTARVLLFGMRMANGLPADFTLPYSLKKVV